MQPSDLQRQTAPPRGALNRAPAITDDPITTPTSVPPLPPSTVPTPAHPQPHLSASLPFSVPLPLPLSLPLPSPVATSLPPHVQNPPANSSHPSPPPPQPPPSTTVPQPAFPPHFLTALIAVAHSAYQSGWHAHQAHVAATNNVPPSQSAYPLPPTPPTSLPPFLNVTTPSAPNIPMQYTQHQNSSTVHRLFPPQQHPTSHSLSSSRQHQQQRQSFSRNAPSPPTPPKTFIAPKPSTLSLTRTATKHPPQTQPNNSLCTSPTSSVPPTPLPKKSLTPLNPPSTTLHPSPTAQLPATAPNACAGGASAKNARSMEAPMVVPKSKAVILPTIMSPVRPLAVSPQNNHVNQHSQPPRPPQPQPHLQYKQQQQQTLSLAQSRSKQIRPRADMLKSQTPPAKETLQTELAGRQTSPVKPGAASALQKRNSVSEKKPWTPQTNPVTSSTAPKQRVVSPNKSLTPSPTPQTKSQTVSTPLKMQMPLHLKLRESTVQAQRPQAMSTMAPAKARTKNAQKITTQEELQLPQVNISVLQGKQQVRQGTSQTSRTLPESRHARGGARVVVSPSNFHASQSKASTWSLVKPQAAKPFGHPSQVEPQAPKTHVQSQQGPSLPLQTKPQLDQVKSPLQLPTTPQLHVQATEKEFQRANQSAIAQVAPVSGVYSTSTTPSTVCTGATILCNSAAAVEVIPPTITAKEPIPSQQSSSPSLPRAPRSHTSAQRQPSPHYNALLTSQSQPVMKSVPVVGVSSTSQSQRNPEPDRVQALHQNVEANSASKTRVVTQPSILPHSSSKVASVSETLAVVGPHPLLQTQVSSPVNPVPCPQPLSRVQSSQVQTLLQPTSGSQTGPMAQVSSGLPLHPKPVSEDREQALSQLVSQPSVAASQPVSQAKPVSEEPAAYGGSEFPRQSSTSVFKQLSKSPLQMQPSSSAPRSVPSVASPLVCLDKTMGHNHQVFRGQSGPQLSGKRSSLDSSLPACPYSTSDATVAPAKSSTTDIRPTSLAVSGQEFEALTELRNGSPRTPGVTTTRPDIVVTSGHYMPNPLGLTCTNSFKGSDSGGKKSSLMNRQETFLGCELRKQGISSSHRSPDESKDGIVPPANVRRQTRERREIPGHSPRPVFQSSDARPAHLRISGQQAYEARARFRIQPWYRGHGTAERETHFGSKDHCLSQPADSGGRFRRSTPPPNHSQNVQLPHNGQESSKGVQPSTSSPGDLSASGVEEGVSIPEISSSQNPPHRSMGIVSSNGPITGIDNRPVDVRNGNGDNILPTKRPAEHGGQGKLSDDSDEDETLAFSERVKRPRISESENESVGIAGNQTVRTSGTAPESAPGSPSSHVVQLSDAERKRIEDEVQGYVNTYGLLIVERNPVTRVPTWLCCKLCPIFGAPHRKVSSFIKAYAAPFERQNFVTHLKNQHASIWKKFEKLSLADKAEFLKGKSLPRPDVFRRLVMLLKSDPQRRESSWKKKRAILEGKKAVQRGNNPTTRGQKNSAREHANIQGDGCVEGTGAPVDSDNVNFLWKRRSIDDTLFELVTTGCLREVSCPPDTDCIGLHHERVQEITKRFILHGLSEEDSSFLSSVCVHLAHGMTPSMIVDILQSHRRSSGNPISDDVSLPLRVLRAANVVLIVAINALQNSLERLKKLNWGITLSLRRCEEIGESGVEVLVSCMDGHYRVHFLHVVSLRCADDASEKMSEMLDCICPNWRSMLMRVNSTVTEPRAREVAKALQNYVHRNDQKDMAIIKRLVSSEAMVPWGYAKQERATFKTYIANHRERLLLAHGGKMLEDIMSEWQLLRDGRWTMKRPDAPMVESARPRAHKPAYFSKAWQMHKMNAPMSHYFACGMRVLACRYEEAAVPRVARSDLIRDVPSCHDGGLLSKRSKECIDVAAERVFWARSLLQILRTDLAEQAFPSLDLDIHQWKRSSNQL